MAQEIKTIGIFGKYGDKSIGGEIQRLIDFLASRKLKIIVEQDTAKLIVPSTLPVKPMVEIGKAIDLAIVVGGDGTLLNVARHLAADDTSMVGVNQGRLGFLSDIPPDRMVDDIGRILDGDFQIEERFLLNTEVMRTGKIVYQSKAFNDVIIHKGELARLIEFETYQGGEFVNSMRADGIIIATPTGSTAYALSAGGPILHPTLSAMVLVPICPHTLSDRPIVVGNENVIEILMIGATSKHARVSFDGQANFRLEENDRIFIRRAYKPIKLIHPPNRSHYGVLRAKLNWGGEF